MSDNDRYAMLIGVSTYDSDAYHDLPPVRADLHYMQAVLESTEIGMYNDCAMVSEPTRAEMLHAIESFLEERQASETALLYFSGHGEFCEADNQLYFLTRDTDRSVARQVHLPALPGNSARAAAAAQRSPALLKARELAGLDARDGVDWQRLLHYYVHCLGATAAAGMMPARDTGRGSKYFLLHNTGETIQSGLADSLPAPANLPRPKKQAAAGPGAAPDSTDALQEYWYGYPAITLPVAEGGGRRRTDMKDRPAADSADGTGTGRQRPRHAPPERRTRLAHRGGHGIAGG